MIKQLYKSFKENFILNSLFFALLFSFISSGVYILYINNMELELFRKYDDFVFGVINYFESKKIQNLDKMILVFEVDDLFLNQQNLLDDKGKTNQKYADGLPRQYLIDFIQKVDKTQPTLLFIDYNLDSNNQIKQDNRLIELLNQNRNYPIYLTHNSNYNFIERKVTNENVHFVSSTLVKNKDGKIRRYQAFIERQNNTSGKLQKYYFAPLIFAGVDTSTIQTGYDSIKNRFIYKERYKDNYLNERSYWGNIYFFSFKTNVISLASSITNDAIIFLGENYTESQDKHVIYNGAKKAGIDILANSLASSYYFNFQLKPMPFIDTIIILFLVTFTIRLFLLLFGINSILPFMIILILINYLICWLLFSFNQIWFNYSAYYIIFTIIEFGIYIYKRFFSGTLSLGIDFLKSLIFT